MEQRRSARGDPRVKLPRCGIIRHDFHLRKSGSDPAGNRTRVLSRLRECSGVSVSRGELFEVVESRGRVVSPRRTVCQYAVYICASRGLGAVWSAGKRRGQLVCRRTRKNGEGGAKEYIAQPTPRETGGAPPRPPPLHTPLGNAVRGGVTSGPGTVTASSRRRPTLHAPRPTPHAPRSRCRLKLPVRSGDSHNCASQVRIYRNFVHGLLLRMRCLVPPIFKRSLEDSYKRRHASKSAWQARLERGGLGGRGGLAVRTLASHQGESGLIPPSIFSHVGIMPEEAAGCRAFSGISRFPRPCIRALLHSHLVPPHRLSRPQSSRLRWSMHVAHDADLSQNNLPPDA
ncbi:hypothetical protein PR048_019377 [Dryococelus australis]|uniref:Uncharacterized protein n=1 Tax=Dryococelus australis TaxID=614101 RepID=A0ABQ9H3B1_9NEOP|nr:hypothetical protein PR048_019377 [Dryococelus australis]